MCCWLYLEIVTDQPLILSILLTRRCCIDNMEAFISDWVIRVKVNKCIWTSGLEWGWRSSATVFTKDRVLWKKTISNLDRMIDQHLGLSYVCQFWTVSTLLKLSQRPQRYCGWWLQGKLIRNFLQTQRNQETDPPA